MVDVNSPRQALTIQLPAELIEELRTLACEKHLPVDDVVMEACLGYTEPYFWERSYQEAIHADPDAQPPHLDADGAELKPAQTEAKPA